MASYALPKNIKGKIACCLVGLAVAALLSLSGVFRSVDRLLYDRLLSLRVNRFPIALNAQIIHADLGDSAEARLGKDVETRKAFADFLAVLGSCNARVAFDFIFRGAASADEDFAASARAASACIMAVVPVEENYANFAWDDIGQPERELLSANAWHIKEHGKNRIPRAKTFILSDYVISSAATELAHIGVLPDSDGVYRRTPLFYRWGDGLIPAISLAVAVRELGIDPQSIEFYPGRFLLLPLSASEAVRIPVDETCSALIPFTASWANDNYRISFDRVALAAHDEEIYRSLFSELSSSMVMAADTTTGKRDFGITPAETVYPLSGIHTALISGIMEEYFYREWGGIARGAAVAVLAALALLLNFVRRDRWYIAAFVGLVAGFTAWTAFAWFYLRLCPWYGTPVGSFSVLFLSGCALRLFSRYREQLLLKNALTRYFPRALAQRIALEKKTELVPAYKELSIVFSDIAGFTNWSRDKEPATVHGFLSTYLESMAEIIFAHGGTVDKYMGDGILAFFGDPVDMPDHPRRCLEAAITMQMKIRELATAWNEQNGIDLKVRMGINTGRVIVGNLGTKQRIEYTVIGADVNLAQRMESSAPAGGILVTAAIREKTLGCFAFGEKRELPVKGYEQPIECYEIVF